MTTLAYRAGVMASDSRAYAGNSLSIGNKPKIHRLKDGSIFAVSSRVPGIDSVLREWVERGAVLALAPRVDTRTFTLLLVKPTGAVFYAENEFTLSGPLQGEFFAIGSGDNIALGAMAMGADAVRAVAIACELDVWTKGPIMTMKLKELERVADR